MNTRRKLVIALGASLLAAPLSSVAQQPSKVRRIGYLALTRQQSEREEALRQSLREFGWIEGQNLRIEYRWAEGNVDRLPVLAEELVRLNVDVIVAWSTPVVQAAKNATKSIPIVIAQSADPVASGFASSLARPGGNITGMSSMSPALAGKSLELLREIVPGLSRVAFLAHESDPAHRVYLKETLGAGQKLGMHIQPVLVKGAEEFESAFSAMNKHRAGALIVQPIFISALGHGPRIAGLALKHRLPTFSGGPTFAETGGLINFGSDTAGVWRHVATYVDKILRGAKPADLPLIQPQTFKLMINMQTAKALGITIPNSILVRADKVIE